MDEMPTEPGPAPEEPATAPASSVTSRRMLMLSAVGASTVIAVRPALAQATASVLTCQIPVPDPGNAGKYIDRNGNVVNPGPLGPLGALFGGRIRRHPARSPARRCARPSPRAYTCPARPIIPTTPI